MVGLVGFSIFCAPCQKRGDDDICALLQSHLDRQVGHQSAIHIGFIVDLDRCKHSRRGHAGTDGQMQSPLVKDLHLTIAVPRRHSPEGDFQIIEIHLRRDMRRQILQERQKPLTVADAPRKTGYAILDTELQVHRVFLLVGPSSRRQLQAVELIQCHFRRI